MRTRWITVPRDARLVFVTTPQGRRLTWTRKGLVAKTWA